MGKVMAISCFLWSNVRAFYTYTHTCVKIEENIGIFMFASSHSMQDVCVSIQFKVYFRSEEGLRMTWLEIRSPALILDSERRERVLMPMHDPCLIGFASRCDLIYHSCNCWSVDQRFIGFQDAAENVNSSFKSRSSTSAVKKQQQNLNLVCIGVFSWMPWRTMR